METSTKATGYIGEITDGIELSGVSKGNEPCTTDVMGWKGNNPAIEHAIDGHVVSSLYLSGNRYWNGGIYPDAFVVGFKMDD